MKRLVYTFTAALLLAGLLSCEDKETAPDPGVLVSQTTLGNVLTDESGRTLYFFANDTDGNSACTGNCLTNWPVFYRETMPNLATSLNAADFSTITRADGTKQTAFRGWPLYYYAKDSKAGDLTGENVGNIWFVAKPDYSIMFANRQLVGHDGKNYTSDYKEGTGSTVFLTDGRGNTLYGFARDKRNKNNYTRADFSNNAIWPIYEVTLKDIPSTLDRTQFGTIPVGNRTQLTYKGWPLYYFGQDTKRGDTKGVSFPSPGIWPIIQKDTPVAPE
ncbi:hypothetical protein [Tellurirhabdus rosea]|uniref:hypothetical protein n=1 Tax=Tellurirhabdus rosea TaxID=2674997 RepID=UPI00224CA51D|nr:hypothetical protein [Tellurirhabdus rosea]